MNKMRTAQIKDTKSIVDIYNQAVRAGFETADTEEVDVKDRSDWFEKHKPDTYPIYVYEIDNKVVGWVSVSPYREGRKALSYTAEISYYIHKDFKRQGIGSELVRCVVGKCKELGYKSLFAIILDKNIASIKLMEKHGFEKWAHLPNIADFNGVECGHVYYGLRIG